MTGIVEVVAREMRRYFRIPRSLEHAAAGVLVSSTVLAAEAKVTILYSQPKSADEFDKYYYEKHMPMVYGVKEIKKVELARPGPGPTGAAPCACRWRQYLARGYARRFAIPG
jgi:hypothetical protein